MCGDAMHELCTHNGRIVRPARVEIPAVNIATARKHAPCFVSCRDAAIAMQTEEPRVVLSSKILSSGVYATIVSAATAKRR